MRLITQFLGSLQGSQRASGSEATPESPPFTSSFVGGASQDSTNSGHSSLPRLSGMPEMKRIVAEVALREMMEKSYFSISTIDKIADLAGVNRRGSDAYRMLAALHCVDFSRMPPELRRSIPRLISEALQVPETLESDVDAALQGVTFKDTYV